MKKLYSILLLVFPLVSFAQIAHTSYSLFASINNADHSITGFEKVVYKNLTRQPIQFIWFKLSPNNYVNDKTAYSEELLKNGDLRFYFSKPEQKGYINQLNFQSEGEKLITLFDSSELTKIKVILNKALQPGDSIELETPFFVKLPYNFTGFGYKGDTLSLEHWYPEIASLENADFEANITAKNSNNFFSNAQLIKQSTEGDVIKTTYQISNAKQIYLGLNDEMIDDMPTLPRNIATRRFDLLIPAFLKDKRPEGAEETQDNIWAKINQNYRINDSSFVPHFSQAKTIQPAFLFNLKETDKYHYLSFLPALGYNNYDKAMVGIMIHNYQLPLNKFNFLLAPMYATNSKTLVGIGRLEYNIWQPKNWWQFSVSGERYSINSSNFNVANTVFLQMNRFVPSISYTKYYGENEPYKKWNFLLKSFIINQGDFTYPQINDTTYTTNTETKTSTIVEFKTTFKNDRALYPYDANFKMDATNDFLRLGFTGNYFFNYDASGKGLNARFFAGKFIYLKTQTPTEEYQTDRYHLNLSGASGAQDYTYSDYFVGRNEYNGWMSQQIMQSDGFFKVSTPQLNDVVGQSDSWLTALNLTADIPGKINPLSVLPFKIPLKAFLDIGTYSDAWQENPTTGRFLYDAGLQVSLLHSAINVYFPLMYSKVYKDYYKNTMGYSRPFVHTISFSINLENLKPKVLHQILPL